MLTHKNGLVVVKKRRWWCKRVVVVEKRAVELNKLVMDSAGLCWTGPLDFVWSDSADSGGFQ